MLLEHQDTDLVTLLEAGGEFMPSNIPDNGWYNHEVLYRGHRFLAPTLKSGDYYKRYIQKQ